MKVSKQLLRIPPNKRAKYEQRHIINISIPNPLLYALRVEAARRGLTLRALIIAAAEMCIRDGIVYRDVLAGIEQRYPKTSHWTQPRTLRPEHRVELRPDEPRRKADGR